MAWQWHLRQNSYGICCLSPPVLSSRVSLFSHVVFVFVFDVAAHGHAVDVVVVWWLLLLLLLLLSLLLMCFCCPPEQAW